MKSNLILRLLLPALVALVAAAGGGRVLGDRLAADVQLRLTARTAREQARLIARLLPWELSGPAMDLRCAGLARSLGVRISVTALDGTRIGDSSRRHGDGGAGDATVSVVPVSTAIGERRWVYGSWRQQRGMGERIVRVGRPVIVSAALPRRLSAVIGAGVGFAALLALWPALAAWRRNSLRIERLIEFAGVLRAGGLPTVPVPQGDDSLARLEAMLGEVGEMRRREAGMAAREQQRLASVLRGMVEGVFVLDADGTVLLSNRRAEELFELSDSRQVEGRSLIELTRHPGLQALLRAMIEKKGDGGAHTREATLEMGRGQVLQVTATAVAGETGERRTFILVCHDITALKRLEEVRRDFVANVSHELRTPLAAIRGYSETLIAGALDDEENARRFLGIIERHATRMGRLVDDLLTLSNLELGRGEARRDLVRPEVVVEAACELLRGTAKAAGVDLSAEVEENLPVLSADADRLVEALVNLLDNAVKYTPAGGSVIVGACSWPAGEMEDAGNDGAAACVEFSVSDTGSGIPSDHVPRLTERFYRVDPARSRELGGTGLGLAIVKHVVQAHGGRMKIESELNHGTTVRLWLPAA